MVADALSRLSMGSLSHVEKGKRDMVKDIHQLAYLGVRLLDLKDSRVVTHEVAKSSLCAVVKEKQVIRSHLNADKERCGSTEGDVF